MQPGCDETRSYTLRGKWKNCIFRLLASNRSIVSSRLPRTSNINTPSSSSKTAVDSPVIAGVAATVQLLQSDQDHVLRTHFSPRFGRSQVDTIKATPADVWHIFIAVYLSVPRVSAVLLFAEILPHVNHARRQPTHLCYLHTHTHYQMYTMYYYKKNLKVI